jgi:hypothetical protein
VTPRAGLDARPINEQSPVGAGPASSLVTNCHQIMVCVEVAAAGIEPSSFDATLSNSNSYGEPSLGSPEHGREDEALRDLVANCHCLTLSVKDAILALMRSCET